MYSVHFFKKTIIMAVAAFTVFSVGLSNNVTPVKNVEASNLTVVINSSYTGTNDGTTAWTKTKKQTASFGGLTLLQTLNNAGSNSIASSIASTSYCFPAGSKSPRGILIGTTKNRKGSLDFNLANGVTATGAVLSYVRYGTSNTATVSVNGGTSQTIKSASGTLTFSLASANHVKVAITTRKKCFYLASIVLTANIPVTAVTLNKSATTIAVGSNETLIATVTPTNASNTGVTWSTSDSLVATVNSAGVVTPVKAGNVTIKATASDGSGNKASCVVTVTQPVTGITLNKTSTTIVIGNTETLVATVLPSDATIKAVSWSSSDAQIATVSSGVVTGILAGNVTITATATDGSGQSGSCDVTIVIPYDEAANNYADSFLSTTSSYCSALDGANIPWATLSAAYEALSAGAKDYFCSSADPSIANAKARYKYLIDKYPTLKADNFIKDSNGTVLYAANPASDGANAANLTDSSLIAFIGIIGLIGFIGYMLFQKRKAD